MARNGSGTYSLPAGNPVTTGSTISSSWANSTLTDIASALTGSIAADGQTTPSANLPMGTYAHTGVANATARTMYASAGQVQDGALTYLTTVAGTDAITAVAPVSMTAYVTGQVFRFVSAGANTGAATININSIGIKSITKNGTTALASGDIASGAAVQVVYDGTQFQLSNPTGGVGDVTLNGTQTLTNKRITPRVVTSGTTTGAQTPTGDTADQYVMTGLTGSISVAAPSGTPTDGQKLTLRFKDNGTGRAITWTTTSGGYRIIGTTLPTTTVASKTIYVGCIYNSVDTFWDVVAVATQA